MGVKYNPFAGNLDIVDSPSGDFSDIDISGDLSLGTGTPTTTLQAVTPTANRTISFPDATGTVALVNGADGTVQYNEAGVLKGNSDFTVDPDWNDAAVTFTGLKLNVTDTASASGSNLLDLQVGGASKAKIDASGDYYGASYSFLGETNKVSIRYGTSRLLTIDQTASSPGARVGSGGAFAWSSISNSEGNPDLFLRRDAANILAQRNGTNAQTFRVYNTYTDASNYERGFFQWNSNVLEIGTEAGGTGTNRTVSLVTGSGRYLTLSNGNTLDTNPTYTRFFAGATCVANINVNSGTKRISVGSDAQFSFSAGTDSFNTAQDTGLARDSAGVLAVTDGSTGTGYIKQTPVAVSALPAAATVGAGTRGFVNDANATTFASVVAGGGSNVVPVYSDGTNWLIG